MRRISALITVLVLSVLGVTDASASSLRGSAAAMVEQNRVAKQHGLPFYRTAAEIRAAAARGDLVELAGNADYAVADFVRFPYAQPEVHLFVERLAAQYREACGQKLVVTSAVRPSTGQPSNAHRLSVHPAGMAVDLRVSDRAACRNWLESAILNLESLGVLNGIREFNPPHYHIALYPEPYLAYVAERLAAEAAEEAEAALATAGAADVVQAALQEAPLAAAMLGATGGAADTRSGNRPPAAALALVLVLPFGLGLLVRRYRCR